MARAGTPNGSSPTFKTEIAIIGMAGRFPGARNVEQFWANIRDGVESIRDLTSEELIAAGASRVELEDPNYVKACPVLDDIDKFDAGFFGFSPREASVMDPAHRFFLEVAWEAIEHAGYTGLPEEGAVGVFAGAGAPLYMIENLRTNPDLMRSMGEFLVRHTGNDMNFMATRVSYEMDLRGPSMNVQTACSSALVSLHLACQSLQRGECDIALAGGSTILVPHIRGYLYKEGEILSPDGHCRPFDAKSAGTVFGSGTGCVVLRRLEDALDDGDTIHAVVKSSAINNDGSVKVGYLAPGVDGQAAAVSEALSRGGVEADSVGYIETHGTGTLVGDPIEVEALCQAFRARTQKRGFCALGSVKSNIGHLGEAAGVASLIKAIMALKHRELPPSLGYDSPNPEIDFDDSPFFVNTRLRSWESQGLRRCGVTALGAGGTNCHVILEEAPAPLVGEGARDRQLLVLSAKTRAALDRASENLARALESEGGPELADAAFTLAVGRRSMAHRRVFVAATRGEAIERLRCGDPKQLPTAHLQLPERRAVFMFPGGGAQYASMGAELYETEKVYREAVDSCVEVVNPALGRDLRDLMFPSAAQTEQATRALEQPSLTLPSLFTTSYALAKLYESWGVVPTAFVGHSMGEYVAACLAGVFSLEDALRLVMLRGRLFEEVLPGAMLSVPLSESDLRRLMPQGLGIAAVNAPELCVASGPLRSIERLESTLSERGIESTRIRIDVAAHSAMLDPILDRFRAGCLAISLQPPRTPFVSNLTGRWITAAEATDPSYWVEHLRSTVRFADCIETVLSSGESALLEVGPGRTLSMLARAQRTPATLAFNSMRHPQEVASDLEYALMTLGKLWLSGVDVDWTAFYAGQLRNRISLPTYPFEAQSFWVEPGQMVMRGRATELAKRSDVSDWFCNLSWARAPRIRSGRPGAARWLVFSNRSRLCDELVKRLGEANVLTVTPGAAVTQLRSGHWQIDPRSSNQFAELVQALQEDGQLPEHVVYMWSASSSLPLSRGHLLEDLGQKLEESFFGPTYLARALGGLSESIQLSVITAGLADTVNERIAPHRATSLGPVLVTPREFPQICTRCIDVPARPLPAALAKRLAEEVIEELRAESEDRIVALRPGERWVQTIAPLRVPPAPPEKPWLRDGGVYLITGGLGDIGLEIAMHLAQSGHVKLALLARAALPPENEWDAILARGSSRGAERIMKLRELRALGAEVAVVVGDVGDAASVRGALARVRAELGPLNGVVHAAGSMDDEPMQTKTLPAMSRVLAPKVQGTLILDAEIDETLDFFVLFSSVASFLGLPGQVDYTAANAFLDAFARERALRAPGRTIVINWNAWRDIGMAARSHRGQPGLSSPCAHPALDGYSDDGPTGRVFMTDFSVGRHWLLAEHQIKDSYALLPGTAFVELARAAFSVGRSDIPVEITNLMFLSPFQVAPSEVRRLNIHLTPAGDAYEIAMRSAGDPRMPPHVIGDVSTYTGEPARRVDLDEIAERCDVRDELPSGGYLEQSFVTFGPRWANIKRIRYGRAEALLELALDERFIGDLEHYRLHPAMLDMATGGAQPLIPGIDLKKDFYVPVSYGRVRFFAPTPQRIFSHVRCLDGTANGLAFFDITLTDSDGIPFADISRFMMKRLGPRSAMTTAQARGRTEAPRNEVMEALLREAIVSAEGLEVFDRIMAQPDLVQVVASSVDVSLWKGQLDSEGANAGSKDGASEGFARPDLASDYEGPSSPTEAALVEIWSELFGIRRMGVIDDFFDLGGNSLVAVRVFAAIKKRFHVSLPLSTLFEAPTIRAVAKLLDGRLTPEADVSPGAPAALALKQGYSSLVAMQPSGTRPAFYCAAGMGGNPLNLAALALLVGLDQPFYGLQPQGLDGQSQSHSSVPDMAAYYLEQIRQNQPQGPYYLGGYSGGGIVAFEMARQLEASGHEVGAIVFLDSFAPLLPRRSNVDRVRLHMERLRERGVLYISDTFGRRVRSEIGRLERLARRPLRKLFPYHFRLESVADTWINAAAQYRPDGYHGDAMLFRAATASALNEGTAVEIDTLQGWAPFVLGGVEVSVCPGDHNTICEQPNVRVLARRLRAYLDRRMGERGQLRAED